MKISMVFGLTMFASFGMGCVAKEITFTILNEMGKDASGVPYKYKVSRNAMLTNFGDSPFAQYTDQKNQTIKLDEGQLLFNRGRVAIITTKVSGTHIQVSCGIPPQPDVGGQAPCWEDEVTTYSTIDDFAPKDGKTYKLYFKGDGLKIEEGQAA